MHIKQIESGALKYIDKELSPVLLDLMDKMLASVCNSKAAQFMGMASADGEINIDAAKNMVQAAIPPTGLVIKLPMGASITVHKTDVDVLYKYLQEG